MKRFSIEKGPDGLYTLFAAGIPMMSIAADHLPDLAHAVADAMAEAMRGLPEYEISGTQMSEAEEKERFNAMLSDLGFPSIHAGEKG